MQTLGERAASVDKKQRKEMSRALTQLTYRGVMRCVMALHSREWHEESIARMMDEIISTVGNAVVNSPAIAEEGAKVTPQNLTTAVVIGTAVAINLDAQWRGADVT